MKEKIIENYIPPCRKCASETFCKFKEIDQWECPLLEKVVQNYIDTNIRSVDTENRYRLSEFIKSVIRLIRIFNQFETWRAVYLDEEFNWYYESAHPQLNSTHAHNLLVDMGKYLQSNRIVKTNRLKRFTIFVEGDSEEKALPPIFSELGVLGIDFDIKNSVKFINLRGKDRAKEDKIRTTLKQLKDEGVDYFLILDNDENVKQYIEELKREELIEESHSLVWENSFEDNFDEEDILKALKEVDPQTFSEITVQEVKEYNREEADITNTIDRLLHEKGLHVSYNDYKVKVAEILSNWVCEDIKRSMHTDSGVYDGCRTPESERFPVFVEKIKEITEKMKQISSDFHAVT